MAKIVSIEKSACLGADYNPVTSYVVHGGDDIELRMDLFEKLQSHFGEDGYFFVDDTGGRGYTVDDLGSVIEWDISLDDVYTKPCFHVRGELDSDQVPHVEGECNFSFDIYEFENEDTGVRIVDRFVRDNFSGIHSVLMTPEEVSFSQPIDESLLRVGRVGRARFRDLRWRFVIENLM